MPIEAFLKMPERDRERILDACVEEFVKKGYRQASTNSMTERLGIAKGSLFYWFGSKEELYIRVIDRAAERFAAAFQETTQEWPTEILARLRVLVDASLAFLEQNATDYRLYSTFMEGEDKHLRDRYIRTRMATGFSVWAGWFAGVDTSDYRAPLEEVQRLLAWELGGIKMEILGQAAPSASPRDLRPLFMSRLDAVNRLLAHAIYKHPAKWGYS